MSYSKQVERLLFHWPAVCRHAPEGWPRSFALSINRQSRRRNWRPSPKQLGVMEAMVSDLFAHAGEEVELIESE